jgi:hypothetical protein
MSIDNLIVSLIVAVFCVFGVGLFSAQLYAAGARPAARAAKPAKPSDAAPDYRRAA